MSLNICINRHILMIQLFNIILQIKSHIRLDYILKFLSQKGKTFYGIEAKQSILIQKSINLNQNHFIQPFIPTSNECFSLYYSQTISMLH